MLIKAKREEDESGALFYSSVLLLLFSLSAWCRSWTLSLFSPAPHSPSSSSSSALPCLHCSREQWRHGSAEEEEVVRLWLLEVEEKVARLWLLCCNTVCKKSSSKLLLLPLRLQRRKQWGPWTINLIFIFTKQLKSTVYLKRSRNRVNKQTLNPCETLGLLRGWKIQNFS